MKVCKDCTQQLPYANFNKKKSNKDGHESRCKECHNIRYTKADPRRVFAKLYHSQVIHSVSRGHPSPTYTLDELKDWVDRQPNAWAIWDAYKSSNYVTGLRPSVDRLDDSKPYSLTNIRLTTWDINRQNGADDKRTGKLNAGHKAITAYTKAGQLHREYVSVNEALRDMGGGSMHGMTSVANGKRIKDGRGKLYMPKTYKGFIWKWTNEGVPNG